MSKLVKAEERPAQALSPGPSIPCCDLSVMTQSIILNPAVEIATDSRRKYDSLSTASVVSVPLWLTPVFSVIEPVNERR